MHYVFTDLHGNGKLWDKIKEKYLKDENRLIFLGDACDRGSDGFRIMKEMLSLDKERFVYLKGNHEDMFVDAAKELLEYKEEHDLTVEQMINIGIENLAFEGNFATQLCLSNGGASTLTDWLKGGMHIVIIPKLIRLPLSCSFKNYDFCHAGCIQSLWENPEEDEEEFTSYVLWDRSHFLEENKWFDGRILIHGHTPTVSRSFCCEWNFGASRYEPVRYAEGTKINLDTGSIRVGYGWVYCIETDKFEKVEIENEG